MINDKINLDGLAHQGGTYSGLQVTLPHLPCGHFRTVPTLSSVTRISILHFGHGISYSTALRTSRVGPSTIDGGSAMRGYFWANV